MTTIRTWLKYALARLAPTKEQADIVAQIKFPCC